MGALGWMICCIFYSEGDKVDFLGLHVGSNPDLLESLGTLRFPNYLGALFSQIGIEVTFLFQFGVFLRDAVFSIV